MTDDLTTARAYLDHARRLESLTDDERANLAKRRQILGSSEDTHALNRSERGAGHLILVLASLYIALGMLSLIADGTRRWVLIAAAAWLAIVHLIGGMFYAVREGER